MTDLLRAGVELEPDRRAAVERWQLERARDRSCAVVVWNELGGDLLFGLELDTIARLRFRLQQHELLEQLRGEQP